MLDPWIIEEILKKEEEARREQERGRAELPLPPFRDTGDKPTVTPPREEGERGVVIIDI
ncbi:MAG: hypothetical protein KF773_15600 [Deltaproteobacteria bacterium]|nr:hypothetical protein [Deltaproteobacteria bacterium]MCW5804447.1 hypothetical protein [Deltaproteobacteria bacterium]